MLYRLALLFAIIIALIPGPASARTRRPKLPADLPTVFVSNEVMAIRNGQQKVTAKLADGTLQIETPYGSYRLLPSIASPRGWVQPTGMIASPKTYRAKDLVTAVVTLAVPDDRKMVLRISAYPGVPAVFVKSGVSGQYGSTRDYYYWSWEDKVGSYFAQGKSGPEERKVPSGVTRFSQSDWVFFPSEAGGLAVITNGMVGYQPGQPFINAIPRSRFVNPGETLDVGFGLAGVASVAEAALLAKTAKAKSVAILKPVYLTKQTKINYGAPAPDWLRKADMLNCWCGKQNVDMTGRWTEDAPVVVGVPADKEIIAKAHKAGMRVIVCVNYAELQNYEVQMQANGKLYRNPDEATPADLLDLAKHLEWTCINADGNERRSVKAVSEDVAGLFATCFHQADLRHNALTQVCNIMNLGADGIYVENAGPAFECYAPKFDKHRHDDPYETNTAAAEELLKEIYKLVKTYGDDKVVVHNSGIVPSHWAYSDAQVCDGFGSDDAKSKAINEWVELHYLAEEHADAIRHGKVPVILSPADNLKECAFYSYAYSKLYGFVLADWRDFTDSPNLAEEIYSIRLGKPISEVKRSGDVLYREFEKGIVALNPTREAVSSSLALSRGGEFTDHGYARKLEVSDKSIRLEMMPESGKVLTWAE